MQNTQQMINGLNLCFFAFVACVVAGRRSLGAGAGMLMVVGYVYGIFRANMLDVYSHFVFDAGLFGLYLTQVFERVSERRLAASRNVKYWLAALMGWPMLLFLVPVNHYLIQLVGLRHIILFLPTMLMGARMRFKDLDAFVDVLAVLNVAVFFVAVLEYNAGIEPFFPKSEVTKVMYGSYDIKTSVGRFHRLPSTFSSAHAYAETLLLTLPFLFNKLLDPRKGAIKRTLMGLSIVLTVMGIFMSGTRTPIVQIGLILALMAILPGLKRAEKMVLMACIAVVGGICIHYVVADQRLQRFMTLSDTEMVMTRTAGSLGFSVFDSMYNYPFGVGLGGAEGSSLPYFLEELAPEQVGAENEYVRITVEQGIIGIGLWLALVANILLRNPVPLVPEWRIGTYAMKAMVLVFFGSAFIGLGMLQSIPATFILLVQVGLLLRNPAACADPDPAIKTPEQNGRAAWERMAAEEQKAAEKTRPAGAGE